MGEEVNPLENVKTMTNANRTCFDCCINIAGAMTDSFSSMVDFLDVRELLRDSGDNFIIVVERSIFVFFLDEVKADQLVPATFAHFIHVLITSDIVPHLETGIDETKTKLWMGFLNPLNH